MPYPIKPYTEDLVFLFWILYKIKFPNHLWLVLWSRNIQFDCCSKIFQVTISKQSTISKWINYMWGFGCWVWNYHSKMYSIVMQCKIILIFNFSINCIVKWFKKSRGILVYLVQSGKQKISWVISICATVTFTSYSVIKEMSFIVSLWLFYQISFCMCCISQSECVGLARLQPWTVSY